MCYEVNAFKCKCCKCHDDFDGCTAFDCEVDFEISQQKVRETAKDYGYSPEFLMHMLLEEKARIANERMREAKEQLVPDDFDPNTDSNFLVSFADAIDIGKKKLVDLDTDELEKLRAEINFILKERDTDE